MLDPVQGGVLAERARHAVLLNDGCPMDVQLQLAKEAVDYMVSVGYMDRTYRDILSRIVDIKDGHQRGQVTSVNLVAREILARNYKGAVAIVEKSNVTTDNEYWHKMETLAQLYFLMKDFKALEEVESRLFTMRFSGADSSVDVTSVRRRVKILLCLRYYANGSYFDCCSNLVHSIIDDPLIIETIDRDELAPFINKNEILSMFMQSVLLAIPMDNYSEFLALDGLENIFRLCPIYVRCIQLLVDTKFRRFFEIWHGDIANECSQNLQLCQNKDVILSTMRSKIYSFYLRICNTLQVSYLSEKLGIDYQIVLKEIKDLIAFAKLNFTIEDDTITYLERNWISEVIPILRSNQERIDAKIARQRRANDELKNKIRNYILEKNSQLEQSAEENSQEKNANIMDAEDVNAVSDNESDTSGGW